MLDVKCHSNRCHASIDAAWWHLAVCLCVTACTCMSVCIFVWPCVCVCMRMCLLACLCPCVSMCLGFSSMAVFSFYLSMSYTIFPGPLAYLHCLLLFLIFPIWHPRSCLPRRFFSCCCLFPFIAKLLPIEIFQYHLMSICTDQYYCVRKARHKYTSTWRNQ